MGRQLKSLKPFPTGLQELRYTPLSADPHLCPPSSACFLCFHSKPLPQAHFGANHIQHMHGHDGLHQCNCAEAWRPCDCVVLPGPHVVRKRSLKHPHSNSTSKHYRQGSCAGYGCKLCSSRRSCWLIAYLWTAARAGVAR